MVRTHKFWRERRTGEVWAIELRDGVVAGVHGPLHWSEINPAFLRAGYEYSREEAPGLEARRDEFELLDEETVILIAGSVD
jgi:hypothetical protein